MGTSYYGHVAFGSPVTTRFEDLPVKRFDTHTGEPIEDATERTRVCQIDNTNVVLPVDETNEDWNYEGFVEGYDGHPMMIGFSIMTVSAGNQEISDPVKLENESRYMTQLITDLRNRNADPSIIDAVLATARLHLVGSTG